jgi:hypothetical protein
LSRRGPLFSIRLEGKAIGEGRIGASHLITLLTQLNKAFIRSSQVLHGNIDSKRRGPKEKNLKELLALDLVSLTHGSTATVLSFERSSEPKYLEEDMDAGLKTMESAIIGLDEVQKPDAALPPGYDVGVLMAWRDLGTLFDLGVSRIQFTLSHREKPQVTVFTPQGYQVVQQRIQGPQINIRTIEGRLLMADFKEHGTRCRVHPAVGEPVLCLFDKERKEEILENILHYVRIKGEAREDSMTGKINSIKIHDIQRLEEQEGENAEFLPQGTPITTDFWQSPSLEELAVTQGVQPMSDVKKLFGTWPGTEDDGFEEDILALRKTPTKGSRS